MVRLFSRSIPEGHHFVPDIFVQHAVVTEDNVRHGRHEIVHERHQEVRIHGAGSAVNPRRSQNSTVMTLVSPPSLSCSGC